jgi:hypothetical protein
MRRAAVLVLLVVVALAPVLPTAAAVPDARLTVSDVTVEPDTPVTDSPTTVTVTVANGAGSPQPATVDRVSLVTGSGGTLAAAEGVGSLGAGASLTVPLTTTFDRAGERSLFVVVEGTDEDGDAVTVRRPVTVVVESAPPLVELRPGRTVVDAQSRTVVELSNPTTEAMRNVVVTLEGPGEAVVERRTVASLAAGAATTINFTSVPRSAGTADLEATIRYTTAVGTQRTVSQSATVEVAPMDADVGVRVQRADEPAQQQQLQLGGQVGQLLGGGGTTTQQDEEGGENEARQVSVVVTNFGNTPVEDVVVTPSIGETTLPRQSLGQPLAPGESASVVVPLGSVEQAGEVTFDVAYHAGTRQENAVGRFDYRPPRGSVRITGVELSFTDDGRLQVSGNAGNVGRGEVTGLVVSVGENEHVRPAYPQRDYFVGTVEGSEFAPFDLTAEVDADNATTVPVEVSYVINGVERTQTVELPYDGSLEQPERRQGIRLPFGGLGLAIAALVAIPAVALIYRYR